MSFDSFRIKNKEGRKVYQENGNLVPFAKFMGSNSIVKNADETSLVQVLNQLNPVVIIDESHNATSELSIEMVANLNPSFILDLTATPRKNSNIICYVDSMQLKRENMIKLPVIVYNRPTQKNVLVDTIDLRNKLEKLAQINETETGLYIRPIVLFQAQPRTEKENTTFEILKNKLIDAGIPAEEIAIKTAEVNELKNVDLLNKNCKIRYIITVNALKEGWDCPFSYILASLANRTSEVDVEQILGRILRQPYVINYKSDYLNMSYVLTSSRDFNQTIENILLGLNAAGFTKKDYRAFDISETDRKNFDESNHNTLEANLKSEEVENTNNGFDFSSTEVKKEIEERTKASADNYSSDLESMLGQAKMLHENYELAGEDEFDLSSTFGGEKNFLHLSKINEDFLPLINDFKIPQFFTDVSPNIFSETNVLLTKEHLLEHFTLSDKPIPTNLAETVDEVIKIDLESNRNNEGTIKTSKMMGKELAHFKDYLSHLPEERQIGVVADTVYEQLKGIDCISATDLKNYVSRIIKNLDDNNLQSVKENVFSVGQKIKDYIDELKDEYVYESFKTRLEKDQIHMESEYVLPKAISPLKTMNSIAKSLYDEECDDLNGTENEIIRSISGLENVSFWHRILERKQGEFYINGYVNHYPDFLIITKSGKVILVEVKGEHLAEKNTKRKAELGKIWENNSEKKFKYFMVFKDKHMGFEGAYYLNDFLNILKSL
jgi:type III restriction enzyme